MCMCVHRGLCVVCVHRGLCVVCVHRGLCVVCVHRGLCVVCVSVRKGCRQLFFSQVYTFAIMCCLVYNYV